MKRLLHNESAPVQKRSKHDSSQKTHKGRRNETPHDRAVLDHDQHQDGVSSDQGSEGNTLELLETVLTGYATHEQQTSVLLGQQAVDHMKSLLSILRNNRSLKEQSSRFPTSFYAEQPKGPFQFFKASKPEVGNFDPNKVPSYAFALPALPDIFPGPFTDAPFVHSSAVALDRVTGRPLSKTIPGRLRTDRNASNGSSSNDASREPWKQGGGFGAMYTPPKESNYERLEFLGDSYLSSISAHIIFDTFPTITPGAMSTVKESLVCNDTLNTFSRAYGFETKVKINTSDPAFIAATGVNLSGRAYEEFAKAAGKGQKGFNKIMADVFEAYVAAVILSDPAHGHERAVKWLKELWTPILLQSQTQHHTRIAGGIDHLYPLADARTARLTLEAMPFPDTDLTSYDEQAVQILQKRICPNDMRLFYNDYEPMRITEDKKSQTFFQSVSLTGWGYDALILGKGHGKSKKEARNWAAIHAMTSHREIVEECERKFDARKEKARREKEATQAAQAAATARKEAAASSSSSSDEAIRKQKVMAAKAADDKEKARAAKEGAGKDKAVSRDIFGDGSNAATGSAPVRASQGRTRRRSLSSSRSSTSSARSTSSSSSAGSAKT